MDSIVAAENALAALKAALVGAEDSADPVSTVLAAQSAAETAVSACQNLEVQTQRRSTPAVAPSPPVKMAATIKKSSATDASSLGIDGLLCLEYVADGCSAWSFASSSQSAAAYELRMTGSKGMGMFAARALSLGERVIAERPLAVWAMKKGDSQEGHLRSFAIYWV